ncbi:transcription factor SRM1 [Heracleum sosnowskyi]|uniref:Transcription factor SRM1 n=1 Tax=Heracleum sosnowskyi TaxID=360622 RepID=A0AAD8LZ55_9APIA|nr:transcription factor SRM1 [Heracleum sosnowskyi]
MSGKQIGVFSTWSREQNKIFETGLAIYPENSEYRWEKIAANVPRKSAGDVKKHYDLLVDDINRIEAGLVPLPCYDISLYGSIGRVDDDDEICKIGGNVIQLGASGGKASWGGQERRKGIPWTEDEHRKFLLGLDKYGKGDWRSISRFLETRTPAQVASHAQKYFIRLNTKNKDRKRTSIHDVTNVNTTDVSVPQGPITCNTNGSPGESSGKPSNQVSQSPAVSSGLDPYGRTTIGEPVGGHFISEIGTPVNLPQESTYGIWFESPGSWTNSPWIPVNMCPVTYPLYSEVNITSQKNVQRRAENSKMQLCSHKYFC